MVLILEMCDFLQECFSLFPKIGALKQEQISFLPKVFAQPLFLVVFFDVINDGLIKIMIMIEIVIVIVNQF